MVKVYLPPQVGGGTIESSASTINDLLSSLDPRLSSFFVNIFINGDDIRFIDGKKSTLKDGDEVSFVPAIAGG